MAGVETDPAKPVLPTDSRDVAWAAVPARQEPETLLRACQDVEFLFRLNPYYYFSAWQRTGPTSYHAEFENQSNNQHLSLDLDVTPGPGRGLTVDYRQGLKKRTFFTVESTAEGSRLLITDDYEALPQEEREARIAEVDKSLVAWAEALRVYFVRRKRWSWLPGWRWYIHRVWIRMKPNQRRIVWFIYLITVVEFFFFLFVMLIWVIEKSK